MNGVPLPVVARLLGHGNVSMTMRYAHVGDREVEAAAERVGQTIAAINRHGENRRRRFLLHKGKGPRRRCQVTCVGCEITAPQGVESRTFPAQARPLDPD